MTRGREIAGGWWTHVLRGAVACTLLLLVPAQGWALCCALGHGGRAVHHGVGAHAAVSHSGSSRVATDQPVMGASRGAPCVTASASSVVLAERAPKLTSAGSSPANAVHAAWTAFPTRQIAIPSHSSRRSAGGTHHFSPLRI